MIEPLGESQVTRVHHDEFAINAVPAAKGVGDFDGIDYLRVNPVRNAFNLARGNAGLNQQFLHVAAQHNDAIGVSVDAKQQDTQPPNPTPVGKFAEHDGEVG